MNPARQLDLGPAVTRANASQHARAKCGPFDFDPVHAEPVVVAPSLGVVFRFGVVLSFGERPSSLDGEDKRKNNTKPSITPALSATQSPTLEYRPGTKL